MLNDAQADPATTGVRCTLVSNPLQKGTKTSLENFNRFYRSPADSRSTRLSLPDDVERDSLPAILQLQAEIDTQLSLLCYSAGMPIGRRIQRSVLDFLEGVEPALRRAFELENVSEGVRKMSRGLFESKADRAKRARLMAKSTSLSEIESVHQIRHTDVATNS